MSIRSVLLLGVRKQPEIPGELIADLEETADRRRILKHLESGNAVKITKIAKDLQMTPGNVHHHTDILSKQGLISKKTGFPKRSYCQITDKGKGALEILKQRGSYE